MRLLVSISLLMLCAARVDAAALPKEILPARETFEVGLEVADKQGVERLKTLGEEYLKQLVVIEREMQSNAQFRALVVVHDEYTRFAKARVMPPRLLDDPVELRDVQAQFQFRLLQTQYSNEMALVKLAEQYVQELATVRANSERVGSASAIKTLDEERDRVIGLTRLRRALDQTRIRPPVSLDSLTNSLAEFGDGGRVRRILDLCRPPNESLNAMIGYTMRVTVYEDLSRLKASKSEGAGTRGRALSGQILYTPRVALSCQHSEIPSGSKLVVEYFSRSIADRARHRESVESVLLPRVERGENYTIETKGIQLYRAESVSTITRVGVSRNYSGTEFYGLILHVVDPDGRVLLQRFAPQALERDLNARPPEK
jgi:hypothetical protein